MTTPKIHLYSLTELKTTLDDHIPIYLSTSTTPSTKPLPRNQRFTPSYIITYIRLGIGYTAVAIALYIFYLDYILKIKFQDVKVVTTLAVVAYFTLNSALTLWQWFGERGLIFDGMRTEGSTKIKLKLHSHPPHRKYEPLYRLTGSWAVHGASSGAQKSGSLEVKALFTDFFASDGYFVPGRFETWLKKAIPIIAGSVDDIGKMTKTPTEDARETMESIDQDSSTVGASSDEGATPSPRKRGRPRKVGAPQI